VKNLIKNNKLKLYIILIYGIYTAIHASCLHFAGDDFWWLQLNGLKDVWIDSSQNGRYFTNMITYLMIQYPVCRWIFYFSGSLLLFFLMTAILKKCCSLEEWKAYAVSGAAIVLVPFQIAQTSSNWISGFPNYVLSACMMFGYLYSCMQVLFDQERKKIKGISIAFLLLGFLSSLCVEIVTIYILMLAVFVIFFLFVRHRKILAEHVTYLIGAAAGTILMFSDRNYHTVIVSENDEVGRRFVELSFLDIVAKIYNEIISLYIKPFFIFHVILAVCLVRLYFEKYQNHTASGYTVPCLVIVLIFTGYSVFTQVFIDFEVISLSYRIRAAETALTFVYLLSLVYLFYQLLPEDLFWKSLLFMIGNLITVMPFVLVNPVTGRCFFIEYLFWVLMTGTVLSAVPENEPVRIKIQKIGMITAFFMSSAILSVMYISNKYCDMLRMPYINKQLAEGNKVIILIELPYPDLLNDTVLLFNLKEKSVPLHGENVSWLELVCDAYGINPELEEHVTERTSFYYYYVAKEVDG